jgi:hypothetical protein
MYRPVLAALVGALSLFALAGCGGSSLVPVTGTVTYKGKALPQGTIMFQPEQGRAASGKIKDGQIVEVTTHTLNDGLAVGKYRVSITAVANPEDMYAKHESLIPAAYNSPDKSGLTAEITSGKNELKFDLK